MYSTVLRSSVNEANLGGGLWRGANVGLLHLCCEKVCQSAREGLIDVVSAKNQTKQGSDVRDRSTRAILL